MILRPSYIEAIAPFIDQPLVKILAGVRRCGKSTIFEMLADELRRRGVPEDRIIKKRYTEMDIPADISAKDMYDDLKLQIQGKGRCYLLLDEIQEVKGWEKTVNSLLEGADVDIYVTGSNSKLMSSEISTYLTGRYVSIPVYPLSFREFLDFKAGDPRPPKELLEDFIRFGGFPIIALGRYDTQSAYQIVNGIYHTVVSRDKIDDDHIADIIQGRPTILPQEVRDVIFTKVRSYACDILDKLRELQVDLRANPAIFIGGGSILFRSFVEESPLVAHADFVTDPKANAIGYGMLATAQLRRMAPQNHGGEFFAQG